jgi:GAF domain-containing protein
MTEQTESDTSQLADVIAIEDAPSRVSAPLEHTDLLDRMDSLASVATAVLTQPDEELTFDRVVRLAVMAIEGCDVATISMREDGAEPLTPAFTDEIGKRADLFQYELEQGPCLDTVDAGRSYVANDLENEPRWPAWAPRAASLGFRSITSVRLVTPTSTSAALNLYSMRRHAFDAEDVGIAHMYGAQASMALSAAHRIDHLRTALDTRHTIGVAQGMLMARFGLDTDRAFEVLRRFSQENNLKLRDVARSIAQGGHPDLKVR